MLGASDFMSDPYRVARTLVRNPAHKRKTFVYETPADTHMRRVDCAEAAGYGLCDHYANGFVIPLVPGQDVDGIKSDFTGSGYHFTEGGAPSQEIESAWPKGTRFLVFPPEQRCLSSFKVPHRIALDHDPLVSVKGGDFRAFTGEVTQHTRIADWVDDLQNSTAALHREIERG